MPRADRHGGAAPDRLRAEVAEFSTQLAVAMTEEGMPKVGVDDGARLFAKRTPFSRFFEDPAARAAMAADQPWATRCRSMISIRISG